MANCLIVQHVEPEPSWTIGAALVRAGIRTDVRRTFARDSVAPDASGYDGVVVMGGPMSACSDDGFASRQAEVALLRAALGRGLPTLGVCLGAQLLALAAGGLVYPGADGPEVGWSGVDLLPTCAGDALFAGFPRRLPVLHCMATRSTCPRERNGWRTTRATRTRLSGWARRPGACSSTWRSLRTQWACSSTLFQPMPPGPPVAPPR
jgi:GMP synthase-like glutamine amidotransferase